MKKTIMLGIFLMSVSIVLFAQSTGSENQARLLINPENTKWDPAPKGSESVTLREDSKTGATELLARYPAGRQPVSDSEKIYRAALLLSVGKVSESEKLVETLVRPEAKPLGQAIKTVIAAVNFDSPPSPLSHLLPSPRPHLPARFPGF